MQIDYTIMILGFVLGLVTGVSTDLINKFISAAFRWIASW